MNPFKMILNSMMMGIRYASFMPFGCGVTPFMPSMFCGSGFMSMPYYQNDNLWFLNSPIYRDTSYDYLLDPNLALKQCQQRWQNGGLYGSTMLPGFTFPQIGSWQPTLPAYPGTPGAAQKTQKTPEQVEAEKQKAAENEKPAHKKAEKYYNVFNKIKKLAENKNNHFPALSDEIVQKAEEAMKKETADEQYEAMKEVMSAIPANVLRKTVLADDNVKLQLRKAGYNFNLKDYTLRNSDITSSDIDHPDRLRQLHSDILERNYNELQVIAGQLADTNTAKARILGIISSWNDKYNTSQEKGLLRFIGANIPTGDDAIAKLPVVKECTKVIVEALLIKADEYEGCAKITDARDLVSQRLDKILTTNGFTKQNINSLADAFDALYARLRMQEAFEINHYINTSKTFSDLKELTENVIDDKIVIEETQKDLEAENIVAPSVDDLDEISDDGEITIGGENANNDKDDDAEADENYADDKQALVDEYLVGEKGYLTKVSDDSNVYKTNVVSSEKYLTYKDKKFVEVNKKTDGSCFERYFTVKDNKLVEVTKKADGSGFEEPTDAKEFTAVDIGKQDAAVKKAQKLIKENKIVEYKIPGFNKFPVFKATGKNQFFAIIDGQFGKIKSGPRMSKEIVEKFTVDDFDSSFDDKDIISAEKAKAEAERIKEEKAREENKDIDAVESLSFCSLADAKSKDGRFKIEEALTGKEPESLAKCKVKALPVEGYFLCTEPKKRYYRYDEVNNKLVYQENVINISDDGYMKIETEKDGKKIYEFKECGEALTNDLSKETKDYNEIIKDYAKRYVSSVSQSDYTKVTNDSCRKLNTLIAMNDVNFTVNFIKGYNTHKRWWNNDFCKQIVRENGIIEGKNIDSINSKRRYLAKIASLIINVFNETTFDINKYSQETLDKYYTQLEDIASGKLLMPETEISDSVSGGNLNPTLIQTAITLDNIIKIVIEAQKDETEQQETATEQQENN